MVQSALEQMVRLVLLMLNFRTGLVLARRLKELLCLIQRRNTSCQHLRKCTTEMCQLVLARRRKELLCLIQRRNTSCQHLRKCTTEMCTDVITGVKALKLLSLKLDFTPTLVYLNPAFYNKAPKFELLFCLLTISHVLK